MTSAQIVPALLIQLVLWRVYARVRRTIGRQPFRPHRLRGAIIFFSLITVLIAVAARQVPSALGALGGGLLLAAPLALLALRLTQFHTTGEEKFYTPNATIGVAVTLLFIGRIVYRVVSVVGTSPAPGAPPTMFQSPLTLLIFGVTAGYYIIYYTGVLLRGEKALRATAASRDS